MSPHLDRVLWNNALCQQDRRAISRAKDAVALYTDSRAGLTEGLGLRDGAQIGAIDEVRREVEMALG